jgi:putative CocE/NonD family hydrolase
MPHAPTPLRQQLVSRFSTYQGYTEKLYDGTRRFSDYLALSDGTRLAYDLILPTKKGVPVDRAFPVLFRYTPYLRTFTPYDKHGKSNVADLFGLSWQQKAMLWVWFRVAHRGKLMDPLFMTPWLGNMVQSGYAVVVVERPGVGASFGRLDPSHQVAASEVNEVLNWIAAQPWCDGNIGMYGESAQAQNQFVAASTGNPHLKAILPASTWIDTYCAAMYPGGVYNKAFGSFYIWSYKLLASKMITPVDHDQDGAELTQARDSRRNAAVAEQAARIIANCPFRDSLLPDGRNWWIELIALYPLIDRINRSGIPVYLINTWYDLFTRDNFLIYANLTVPKRLLVRPLDHSQVNTPQADLDYAAEVHRWFDYWLKGIDNGIMAEPPIHYYLQGVSKQDAWQSTEVWPLDDQEMTRYYFGAGASGGATPVTTGTLTPSSPTAPEASDAYRVDYTTTTGTKARWTAVNWAHQYPDLSAHDAKALTYTTAPLPTAVQVVGHALVHVWCSCDAPDVDLFAYLEEVDGNGHATYITEGNLRASHRGVSQAPYENLGLPYHTHFQSELQPILAGEPVELVFDLLPTAYQFQQGHRIRLTIACADADNFATLSLNPAPTLHVLRETSHPSSLDLPIVHLGFAREG